jgi:hypothetical protein
MIIRFYYYLKNKNFEFEFVFGEFQKKKSETETEKRVKNLRYLKKKMLLNFIYSFKNFI